VFKLIVIPQLLYALTVKLKGLVATMASDGRQNDGTPIKYLGGFVRDGVVSSSSSAAEVPSERIPRPPQRDGQRTPSSFTTLPLSIKSFTAINGKKRWSDLLKPKRSGSEKSPHESQQQETSNNAIVGTRVADTSQSLQKPEDQDNSNTAGQIETQHDEGWQRSLSNCLSAESIATLSTSREDLSPADPLLPTAPALVAILQTREEHALAKEKKKGEELEYTRRLQWLATFELKVRISLFLLHYKQEVIEWPRRWLAISGREIPDKLIFHEIAVPKEFTEGWDESQCWWEAASDFRKWKTEQKVDWTLLSEGLDDEKLFDDLKLSIERELGTKEVAAANGVKWQLKLWDNLEVDGIYIGIVFLLVIAV
jgi:hypothetical protein